MSNASDPNKRDIDRTGRDLIARIDELARARGIDPHKPEGSGEGWIYLLLACHREIRQLNKAINDWDLFGWG